MRLGFVICRKMIAFLQDLAKRTKIIQTEILYKSFSLGKDMRH